LTPWLNTCISFHQRSKRASDTYPTDFRASCNTLLGFVDRTEGYRKSGLSTYVDSLSLDKQLTIRTTVRSANSAFTKLHSLIRHHCPSIHRQLPTPPVRETSCYHKPLFLTLCSDIFNRLPDAFCTMQIGQYLTPACARLVTELSIKTANHFLISTMLKVNS